MKPCYVPIKRHGSHSSEDSNLHEKPQLELSVRLPKFEVVNSRTQTSSSNSKYRYGIFVLS